MKRRYERPQGLVASNFIIAKHDLDAVRERPFGCASRVPSKSIGLKGTPHPHVLLVVGGRGLFADDAFLALDVCGTLDNDGP